MKLLNVGAGGHRPQSEEWWNLDELRKHLKPGTPERTNLDAEPRYIECSLTVDEIPGTEESYDGILLQHVLEHFDCAYAVMVIQDCMRMLKPTGVLVASVPNVDYFRMVHTEDTRKNASDLFGESISGDWQDNQCQSFFEYALWHRHHKQILNTNGLWALLRRAGFEHGYICVDARDGVAEKIAEQLNRKLFSAILYAYKG